MTYASDAHVLLDDFMVKAMKSISTGEEVKYSTTYGSVNIRRHKNSPRYVYVTPENAVDFSIKARNKGVLVDVSNNKKALKGLRVALMRTKHNSEAMSA